MATSRAEGKRRGRPGPKGDERMNRAVMAREANPELPLLDALLDGGFVFPGLGVEKNDKMVRDTDGVTLSQRKNQLMRRQREAKQRTSKTKPPKKREKKSSNRKKASQPSNSNPSDTVDDPTLSQNLADMEISLCEDDGYPKFDLFDNTAFEEMVYPQEEQKEFGTLSEKEMIEIVHDLYGTPDIPTHRSTVTDNMLYAFDEALNEIPFSEKMSLIEAQRIDSNLVDRKQKAMFLRWAEYDVRQAAARYVTYWNNRQQLFGDDAFYPLTLDRALERENIMLLSHPHRILPQKDEHGRAIIWSDPGPYNPVIHSKESVIRCFWYNIHNALEDESVQENGFVFVGDVRNADVTKHFDRGMERLKWKSIRESLPMKFRALHVIKPSIFGYLVLPIIKFLIGRIMRFRFIMHTGTEKEVLASLSTYGISEDIVMSQTRR